jgi:ribosomal protein S18 acetylase RimI-like enzyme
MLIRAARSTDVAALVEFNLAMAFETEGKTLDTERLRRGVEAVLSDPKRGFYIVAEDDGHIVGGLLVTFEWSDWRDAWFWWVQSVYTRPEARGRGVYRRLYEHLKAKSVGKNVCGFRLYVEIENKLAQDVYERLGMHRSAYLMYEE